MDKKDLFLQLSQQLTGCEALNRLVSDEYYNNLYEEYKEELIELIDCFKSTQLAEPLSTPQQHLLNVILYLWYSSEMINKTELANFNDSTVKTFNKIESYSKSPLGYYEGLVWKAAKAHPVGLTGGYFGYWKYRPEN